MNINLSNVAKKRNAKKPKPSNRQKRKSVLEESSSSSEDDAAIHKPSRSNRGVQGGALSTSTSTSIRASINRELIAEQAALRKQAQKAMSSSNYHVLDYDAEYESFSAGHLHQVQTKRKDKEDEHSKQGVGVGVKRKSRYMKALLKKAQDRQQEQEIITERQIAKEQALEEEKEEYAGKEKFVTQAYKQKLAEREVWLKEEEKRTRLEEEQDVTKRNHQGAMVGFYNNIMASGTTDKGKDETVSVESSNHKGQSSEDGKSERKSLMGKNEKGRQYDRERGPTSFNDDVMEENESDFMRQSRRAKKLEKIFAARDRYLKRRDAAATSLC